MLKEHSSSAMNKYVEKLFSKFQGFAKFFPVDFVLSLMWYLEKRLVSLTRMHKVLLCVGVLNF